MKRDVCNYYRTLGANKYGEFAPDQVSNKQKKEMLSFPLSSCSFNYAVMVTVVFSICEFGSLSGVCSEATEESRRTNQQLISFDLAAHEVRRIFISQILLIGD